LHERWKVNIRLDKETYRTLKAHLVELGTRPRYRDASRLEEELRQLPYQGYEPVVRQLLAIMRAVNRHRRRAGYVRVNYKVVTTKRVRVTTVFVEDTESLSTDVAA
jgi:hypothetical protein